MQNNQVVLVILDGFGHNEDKKYNAVLQANTPNIDELKKTYPHTLINASESAVGLPVGQMGNSEVGHLSIGSGRIIPQDLERINTSIKTNEIFAHPKLIENFKNLSLNNNSLHIFGLLSDGGVHSYINHFEAIIKMAKQQNVKKVYIHAFLDGRDTPPKSAKKYLAVLEDYCSRNSIGKIISVCGRFYAMDRDKRWERTEAVYDLVVNGKASFYSRTALEALDLGYKRNETDEFLSPTVIQSGGTKIKLQENDSIVFMNFRSDRARQITDAILNDNFDDFQRHRRIKKLSYFTLTNYDESQKKATPIFPSIHVKNTLGEFISDLGKTQLRIAETEKYPHVTFFFNGGDEKLYKGEDRVLINSPKVETYDLKPEMSAYELTDKLSAAIESKKYDLIICNYANGDMVGHTGILNAAIKAIETLDDCIGRVAKSIKKVEGHLIITADHGNAELMTDDINQQAHTQHTTNLVPLIYMGEKSTLKSGGKLSDIAPTIISIMGEEPPKEMTGINLINFDE
ncbi:MAG: 2,3-bisphosphoglycerate-independent phosphoglycerate mutase [Methylophilaceae bacterium]|nr:2,3-bisphosphoglycerate-independent phosphoglycerate mutase [Methylophilaceae bacterium]